MSENTISKLQALQKDMLIQQRKSSLEQFKDKTVVYLGVAPKPFFPKLKNEDGSKILDENGRDKRSETSTGFTYTFSEFGTSKIVKIVLKKEYNLDPLSVFVVAGAGYDIKNSNMIFIQEDTSIRKFE